jgi:serine/threonine-protein kinase
MRALVPKNTVETVLRPGQVVGGQYRVDHLIGQGGMAAVWAGTNEHTGKRVALKVILLSLSTTREAQDLFHGEALAASRVNHPNVVTVFDVIGHEGMACIVMEMLDGETLAHYLAREGALSVDRATALLLPAMRGVAAANAQGVVHRDLKPQNIFICSEPDGRIVTTKVLDFGISVIVERGIDTSSAPKSALGTPGYMSPEHILGAANIDGRADVYGFGLLLYESLTGKMAFPGEPNTALFDRVLTKPALPVMVLRPDLPSGLVHIIEKAMAKDRDQRYSDLNAMVAALEDELMPTTPAPRLLTPLTAVASPSGNDGVEATLNSELSRVHQETQFLFAFPLEGESKESSPNGKHNTKRSSEELAASSPIGRAKVRLRPSSRDQALAGRRNRSVLRRWPGFVGAGLAVALGSLTVSMPRRGATLLQGAAPARVASAAPPASESEPRAHPPVPAVLAAATVDLLAVPAPWAASLSPPAPTEFAMREQSEPERQPVATLALVAPRRTRVAPRATSKNLPSRPQALRKTWESDEPPAAASPAPGIGASPESGTPRAGRLSKDDF